MEGVLKKHLTSAIMDQLACMPLACKSQRSTKDAALILLNTVTHRLQQTADQGRIIFVNLTSAFNTRTHFIARTNNKRVTVD